MPARWSSTASRRRRRRRANWDTRLGRSDEGKQANHKPAAPRPKVAGDDGDGELRRRQLTEHERDGDLGHEGEGGEVEKRQQLTLGRSASSNRDGEVEDGRNRRRGLVGAEDDDLRFRAVGSFPASVARRGCRGGPGASAEWLSSARGSPWRRRFEGGARLGFGSRGERGKGETERKGRRQEESRASGGDLLISPSEAARGGGAGRRGQGDVRAARGRLQEEDDGILHRGPWQVCFSFVLVLSFILFCFLFPVLVI